MSKIRPQLAQDGAATNAVLTFAGAKWTGVLGTAPSGAAGGDLS